MINKSNELNTIIFSTHDIELAVELADSIYIIGYPQDRDSNLIHAGTILKHFDLKHMGLAWQDHFNGGHLECVNEIKSIMVRS